MAPRTKAGDHASAAAPENIRLTTRHAEHLGGLTGGDLAAHVGKPFADIAQHIRPEVVASIFGCRVVTGRVVTHDRLTGELQGVPGATVYVEDTDASLFWLFPDGEEYGWFRPLWWRREVIATAVTDGCGEFRVCVPRWDIDRVVRWRLERHCLGEIGPIRVKDVLDRIPLPHDGGIVPPRGPGDPPPDAEVLREARGAVETRLGRSLSKQVLSRTAAPEFAAPVHDETLALRAFPPRTAPPPRLATEHFERYADRFTAEAEKRSLDAPRLTEGRWYGPFWRCTDVLVPQTTIVFDVPDITFRVTQVVHGVEQTIYDEGPFDVRWNDTTTNHVQLEASGDALGSSFCGDLYDVPCTGTPEIGAVGLLPVAPGFVDDGWIKPTNRPSPDGVHGPGAGPGPDDAFTPFCRWLHLVGCVDDIPGADRYRVVTSRDGGPEQPLVVPPFQVPAAAYGAPPVVVHPDPDGWVPVATIRSTLYPHLLIEWWSPLSPDGAYTLAVEVDAGGTTHRSAHPVTLRVDNMYPRLTREIRAWDSGRPRPADPLPEACPVYRRAAGHDVEIEVTWTAYASHLRSASCYGAACGGGSTVVTEGADDTRQWWYRNAGDTTTGTKVSRFRIPAGSPDGAYHVRWDLVARAVTTTENVAGPDWRGSPAHIATYPDFVFALVTA